jgi:hypothetical protein
MSTGQAQKKEKKGRQKREIDKFSSISLLPRFIYPYQPSQSSQLGPVPVLFYKNSKK